MSFYIPTKLLNSGGDSKTIKGLKKGWVTFISYLSPYTDNSLGINICSHASAGCVASCLVGAGRGGFTNSVIKGRRNKTEFFLRDRTAYLNKLVKELTLIDNKFRGEKVAIRLNGTSDIRFEKFKIKDNKNIFELFPNLTFYDYTKNHLRFNQELPSNYFLVFSRSETNHEKAIELLRRGVKVAMVFDNPPTTFEGFEVVDGDETDLTFLQKDGVIIGLKYKKMTSKGADNNVAFESGFAISTQTKVSKVSLKKQKA
jgi:hypothetical protein